MNLFMKIFKLFRKKKYLKVVFIDKHDLKVIDLQATVPYEGDRERYNWLSPEHQMAKLLANQFEDILRDNVKFHEITGGHLSILPYRHCKVRLYFEPKAFKIQQGYENKK